MHAAPKPRGFSCSRTFLITLKTGLSATCLDDAQRPTAWLGMRDSNSEMSGQNIPLKGRTDFRRSSRSRPRDYARSKCDGGRRNSDLLPGSGCLRWQSLITEPRRNDDDKTCSLAAHAVRRCSPSSSIVVAPAVSTPIHPTVNSAVMPIIGLGLIDTQL